MKLSVEADADTAVLRHARIAVPGCGSQGRAHAHSLNLHVYANERQEYDRLWQADLDHPIRKAGRELRACMAWLEKRPAAA